MKILKNALCCVWILSINFACDAAERFTQADLESWVQNLRNRKEDVGAAEFQHQPLLDFLEKYLRDLEKEDLEKNNPQ